ncbi:metallopeptidase TldD-related protein [Bradyrhizobium uaiense]|nr:metallopeptidase TldD-related protein [Bradyrhizobium uaiense]
MAMPRACEQGILLTVGMAWPGGPPVVQETRFAAHCEGAERRSGPPPVEWGVPDADTPPATPPELALLRLKEFVTAVGQPASLRYSRVIAQRWILEPFAGWRCRPINVFALTGRLQLANGRFMPVGWSGTGDGLARLQGGAARQHLVRVARNAGEANATAPGDGPAVLAAQPAALIAHEAIGHFAEASADSGVDLRHRLGCRLAADDIDVLDDPTCKAAACYEVDDDGIMAMGATRILKDGVLVRQLHGRASALAAGDIPTANARSSQITLPPIPRMSNLIVLPGTSSFGELVDSVGDGVIIHHLSHGFSRGLHVEARIVLGEIVATGRATGRFFTGGRVEERVDVLTGCMARSRESELNPNALCGKHGQILYDVGTVAPALQLSRLRIVG